MSKGDVSWTLQRSTGNKFFQHCTSASPYHICAISNKDHTPGDWTFLTADWVKTSYLQMYADGKNEDRTVWKGGGTNWSYWRVGTDAVGLGYQARGTGEADRYWDGVLDEARVKEGTSTPDWIKLVYESQKGGSTVLTFGQTATAVARRNLPGWLPAKEGRRGEELRIYDLQGRMIDVIRPGRKGRNPALAIGPR
jgi:hypothetical protein